MTVGALRVRPQEKVSQRVGDLEVSSIDDVAEICRDRDITFGVIAVPADSAQNAADALISAGAKIIFNYSEALLDVPSDVNVVHLQHGRRSPLRTLLPSDVGA